jgi:transposase-like protein
MINPSLKEKIIREYLEKKISYYGLEIKYGVNRNTIATWVKLNGFETKYFKNIPEQEVVKLYSKDKKSVEYIAKKFGCSISPVKRVLQKFSIDIRDNSQRHIGQVSWNKGKKWSKSMKDKLSTLAFGRKQTGEDNPNWRGGNRPRFDKRRNWRVVRYWRLECLHRDLNTCLQCGSKNRVEVNHIIPIRQIKDMKLLADVNNGITLCRKCHVKIHYREHQYADFFRELLKNWVNSGKTLYKK